MEPMWLIEPAYRERKCAEIIINDTINLFLKTNNHFDNFKP